MSLPYLLRLIDEATGNVNRVSVRERMEDATGLECATPDVYKLESAPKPVDRLNWNAYHTWDKWDDWK